MSGPPHQFNTGFQNSPAGMRSQFGGAPMPGQMGGGMPNPIGNQLGNQMPVQIGGQMVSPMASSLAQLGQSSMGGNV